jgi:mannose-1-phosphate guanylyltransferase
VVSDLAVFDAAVVITNFDYRFRVAEQLREIGAEATILLERLRSPSTTRSSTPRRHGVDSCYASPAP